MASLTLDEVRDFLAANIRAAQRFSEEQQKVLTKLENNEDKEWLESAQQSLKKGETFHATQAETWQLFAERMDGYVMSVRALADELAMKELHGPPERKEGDQEPQEQDARFVHPELRRFKAEKQARIVGKYGGAPALGGLVLPSKPRNTILKATATPAAREIQYSKAEGRDARELAEVMRFKAAAKDQEQSAWQAEIEAKKGRGFLTREQEQEAAEAATIKAAAQAASHSPFSKELIDRLSQRQAEVQGMEGEQQAAQAELKKAEKVSNKSEMSDELAQKLARMQQLEKKAQEAAERQAACTELHPEPQASSTAWGSSAPFGAELAGNLQKGTGNVLKSAVQPDLKGRQQLTSASSELEERFRKLRERSSREGAMS